MPTPFSSFLRSDVLHLYAEELKKLEPFTDYPFDQFDAAIQEAINWGLLSPKQPVLPNCLDIQPVFPYFLKTKVNQLDTTTQEGLKEGFKNHYIALGNSYYWMMESKEPNERQMGITFCSWEYENLFNGLKICLNKQQTIDIYQCLEQFFLLNNDYQNSLKLGNLACQAIEQYSSQAKENLGIDIVIPFGQRASSYLSTQQYKLSKDAYLQLIKLINSLTSVDTQQKQSKLAVIYHQLGCVAHQLREWQQARQYYQTALAICVKYGDRYEQAKTYRQLGRVAEELQQWQQAKDYYQTTLEIKIEYGARYEQASTYHCLGVVAHHLREWVQAKNYYQTALEIKIEYGNRYEQAKTYHQLGSVAHQLREWQQAIQYYRTALEIYVESSARYEQAGTYHQLGYVAQQLREWQQAIQYYQTALNIFIEYGDRYNQAKPYHHLGAVAEELREWQQAIQYYQAALEIKIEYGDRFNQASSYHQLGRVAQETGELAQAKANYLQAFQIWAEFKDTYSLETYSLPALTDLYQQTQDESILEAIAGVFRLSVGELRGMIIENG